MQTVSVLRTVDDLTTEWLTAGLGSPVRSFTVGPIGTGQLSGTFRVVLDWDGPVESVIIKLADTDPAVRSSGVSLGLYEREVRFYNEIAERLPTSGLAHCHAAAYDTSEGYFTLLVEDVSPAHPGDQIAGCSADEAKAIVIELAKIQAAVWGNTELAAWMTKPAPADSLMLEMVLPLYYKRFAGRVSDEHRVVVERFIHCFDTWFEDAAETRCMSHSDFRVDNILFGEEGSPRPITIVDWATSQWLPATNDLAFFIGGNLTVEDRREHEHALVKAYHDTLKANGVKRYSFADCWRGYRWNAFAGVLMAIGAPMLVSATERGDTMFMTMLARHCQQVIDLDSMSLLEAARTTALTVDPTDEERHEPDEDRYWNESYYLDAISADGKVGAYVRFGFVPPLNRTVFTAYIVGEGRPSVGVLDYTAPLPVTGATVTTDTFTSSLLVEEPLKQVRVTLNGKGESYADPTTPLRGESGTPVDVEMDLVWESEGAPYQYQLTPRYEIPCRVRGTVTVDGEVLKIDGPGQRDHSWGPRDWWAMDWTWVSAHLDDDTRMQTVELRFPGIPITAVGYEQDARRLTEVKSIAAAYEIPANRQPGRTSATMNPSGMRYDFEPIAYGNLRIESPDGRVCEFPRAMARITTPDGRTGLGWLEWGHNVEQAPTRGKVRQAVSTASQMVQSRIEQAAKAGLALVPDIALEKLMNSRAGSTIVAAIFRAMPGRLDHRAAEGLDAITRFRVRSMTTTDVDVYDLVLPAMGRPSMVRHKPGAELPDARLSMTLTPPDLLGLATGRLDAVEASVTRRIVLEGDMKFMATLAPLLAKSTGAAPTSPPVVGQP
jgi:Ecdysteroid kinase-like family/SCP-2 sterol transfer family